MKGNASILSGIPSGLPPSRIQPIIVRKEQRRRGPKAAIIFSGAPVARHPNTKQITVFERLPTYQKPPVHIYIYIPRPSLRPHPLTAPHRTTRRLPPDHDVSRPSQASRAPRKRSGHASSIAVSVPPSASICILPFPADDRNPPASCGARTRKPSSGGRCVFLGGGGGAAVRRMVRAGGIF